MNKNIAIGVLLGVAAVLGVVSARPVNIETAPMPTPIVNVPAPIVNVEAPKVTVQAAIPAPSPSAPIVGSVTGPFSYFSQTGVNGVIRQPRRVETPSTIALATSTICSIQAPTQGTSTLTYAFVKLDVSSTTASIIDIAKSSNTGATTTKIGTTYTISANASAAILASTSPAAGDVTVFGPGQYLVVNMKGGANNGFFPTGVCTAEWMSTF